MARSLHQLHMIPQ
ncbi:hypothetical protein Egran_04610 [Elaphomyces granulatus]|uniref:Uncharacterized protein n=1 Tax=Elaphomyces granulatus TaxID=519963 RepID=A0A232LUW3_9EURO|nr:hypothetical protein Egran_04610 [Elaphomyces granulatus]